MLCHGRARIRFCTRSRPGFVPEKSTRPDFRSFLSWKGPSTRVVIHFLTGTRRFRTVTSKFKRWNGQTEISVIPCPTGCRVHPFRQKKPPAGAAGGLNFKGDARKSQHHPQTPCGASEAKNRRAGDSSPSQPQGVWGWC